MMTTPDMEAVVERLTGAVSDDEAHWSMDPDAPPAVDVRVDDLRALLSERRKMVEALEPFAKMAECLEDDYADDFAPSFAPFNTAGQIRKAAAALTGSREHG